MPANIQATPLKKTAVPARSVSTVLPYTLLIGQFLVLAWLVQRYAVEESLGLPQLLPVLVPGFLIHLLLPRRLRLPFFIGLSLIAACWLFDWIPALIFCGLFALFFGILQLPFSVNIRAGLLATAGAALAWLWGVSDIAIPGDHRIIPVIGSIFMFRASVYLYDVRHQKSPAPFEQQLAYFLMLPNLVFTLFPVVDYKLFRRSYYARPALDIYQKGVRLMIRGFFHLMLYRIIYYYVQPAPEQVTGLLSFALFALTSYLLILRLSGLFHFAVGILCLFGFDLPRVFHNYFLASGFSDLWRRINVYWRDYIMKVFYYPIYFRLRDLGKNTGMVLAILLVFALTWLLHSYQWFWIKGAFPIRVVDMIFWGLFGILVAGNALWQQARTGKKRAAIGGVRGHLIRAVQVIAMLSFMSVLWTFWNSPTVSDWLQMAGVVTHAGLRQWAGLAGMLAGGVFLLTAGFRVFAHPRVKKVLEPDDSSARSAIWGSLTLLSFVLLCLPSVLQLFSGISPRPVEHVYEMRLTEADDAEMIRGYYEDILVTNQLTSPLTEMRQRPKHWVGFQRSEAAVETGDWRRFDLKPNVSIMLKDARFTTNEWGMRDDPVQTTKPPNTFRLGIIGGSYVVGSGVDDDQIFASISEEELNNRALYNHDFELLNFAVPAYHLLHNVHQFDEKVGEFDMDALALVSHGLDVKRLLDCTIRNYYGGFGNPFPFLDSLVTEAGFHEDIYYRENYEEWVEKSRALTEACYAHIADGCRERGMQPVLLFWPRTTFETTPEEKAYILETAEKYGFLVLDLSPAYEGLTTEDLQLAPWDNHPNVLGHRLIAEELVKHFENNAELRVLIQQNTQ